MARQVPAKKSSGRKVTLAGGDVTGGPHGEIPGKNIVVSGGKADFGTGTKSTTMTGGPTGNRKGKTNPKGGY